MYFDYTHALCVHVCMFMYVYEINLMLYLDSCMLMVHGCVIQILVHSYVLNSFLKPKTKNKLLLTS